RILVAVINRPAPLLGTPERAGWKKTGQPMPSCSKSLPLTELEALARALLSVFFTFLAASIAGKEAFGFQFFAQLEVELQQGAGNAHPQSAGLAIDAAAGNVGRDIEGGSGLAGDQR